MAERTDSIYPSEQQPPARARARRSWYSRPASLASPSSPCLNRGLAPGPVHPCTPLQDIWSTPEATRPRKSQPFGSPDVTVRGSDAVVEERRTRIGSESGSVQEEDRSYTPDYSPPPEASFGEPGSLGDSRSEVEKKSGGEDVSPGQSPATPSKNAAEHHESPTKATRIISGLLSSPAKVHRSPGQLLITKTCRRSWFVGHNVSKCKRFHGTHGKEAVKKKEEPAAGTQGPRMTRLTQVFIGRVAKRTVFGKRTTEGSGLS